MANDQLFHKRKAKAVRDTQRRQAYRQAYDKVLIVCEGEKTEPEYFSELVDHYQIHSANVLVTGDCGSDPLSIVNYAFQLEKNELKADSGAFDRVYCVFDRDTHTTYPQALSKIAGLAKSHFYAITSVPCFEYWLLLHFNYSTAPFMPSGKLSAGYAVVKQLQAYWPDYNKAMKGTFTHTLKNLEFAKANAKRAIEQSKVYGDENPSTHVHQLVDYLQKIKIDCKT